MIILMLKLLEWSPAIPGFGFWQFAERVLRKEFCGKSFAKRVLQKEFCGKSIKKNGWNWFSFARLKHKWTALYCPTFEFPAPNRTATIAAKQTQIWEGGRETDGQAWHPPPASTLLCETTKHCTSLSTITAHILYSSVLPSLYSQDFPAYLATKNFRLYSKYFTKIDRWLSVVIQTAIILSCEHIVKNFSTELTSVIYRILWHKKKKKYVKENPD